MPINTVMELLGYHCNPSHTHDESDVSDRLNYHVLHHPYNHSSDVSDRTPNLEAAALQF